MQACSNSQSRVPNPRLAAFTLVELAIVLVVIGLVIGGIMLGRALLGTGALRGVIADAQKYQSAVNGFQAKYDALPGDMKNATSYWGTDANGCPTHTTRTIRTATCNGDGDGLLGDANPELFRAWQHLGNSALITGSFTGVTGAGGAYNAVIGENVPAASMEGGGFAFHPYLGNGYGGDANRYAADYGEATLVFGREDGTESLYSDILSPTDAWNLDTKMDNGLPGSGRITPLIGAGHTNCVSSATAYAVSYTGVACTMLFNITG